MNPIEPDPVVTKNNIFGPDHALSPILKSSMIRVAHEYDQEALLNSTSSSFTTVDPYALPIPPQTTSPKTARLQQNSIGGADHYNKTTSIEHRNQTSRVNLVPHNPANPNQPLQTFPPRQRQLESISYDEPSFTEMGEGIQEVYTNTMTIGPLPFSKKPESTVLKAGIGIDTGINNIWSLNCDEYCVGDVEYPFQTATITKAHLKDKIQTEHHIKQQQYWFKKCSLAMQKWLLGMPSPKGNSFTKYLYYMRYILNIHTELHQTDYGNKDYMNAYEELGPSKLMEMMKFNSSNQMMNMNRKTKISTRRFFDKNINRCFTKVTTIKRPTSTNPYNRDKVIGNENFEIYYGDGKQKNKQEFPYTTDLKKLLDYRVINPIDKILFQLGDIYTTKEPNTSKVCPLCIRNQLKVEEPELWNTNFKFLQLVNGGSISEIISVHMSNILLNHYYNTPDGTVRQLNLNLPEGNNGKGIHGILRCQSCSAIFNRDTGVGAWNIITSGNLFSLYSNIIFQDYYTLLFKLYRNISKKS